MKIYYGIDNVNSRNFTRVNLRGLTMDLSPYRPGNQLYSKFSLNWFCSYVVKQVPNNYQNMKTLTFIKLKDNTRIGTITVHKSLIPK